MIDSQSAVSSGLYAALDASAAVRVLAAVWQNPPENTQPPVAIIGLVALDATEDKDGGFDKATVQIETYIREPDATKLYALNSAIRNALEGKVITAGGAEISRIAFLSADPQLMEDGITYADSLRFEMWVQAA